MILSGMTLVSFMFDSFINSIHNSDDPWHIVNAYLIASKANRARVESRGYRKEKILFDSDRYGLQLSECWSGTFPSGTGYASPRLIFFFIFVFFSFFLDS